SPRRPLDASYREFFELAADHVAMAIGNARAQQERREFVIARQRTEATTTRLNEALTLIDAMLASVPVGICYYDCDLRIVHTNDALAQLNGIPRERLLGMFLADVVAPASYGELAPKIRQVFVSGTTSETIELFAPALATPEIPRHWLVTFFPVRGPANEVIQ